MNIKKSLVSLIAAAQVAGCSPQVCELEINRNIKQGVICVKDLDADANLEYCDYDQDGDVDVVYNVAINSILEKCSSFVSPEKIFYNSSGDCVLSEAQQRIVQFYFDQGLEYAKVRPECLTESE